MLLVSLIRIQRRKKIGKTGVGSSRAVYREGKYLCRDFGLTYPTQRSELELARKQGQMYSPKFGLSIVWETEVLSARTMQAKLRYCLWRRLRQIANHLVLEEA